MIRQALILLILAAVVSLAVNLISPNKIAYVGQYRELSSGNGPVVPPTAEPGDPPFIDINVAQMEWTLGDAIFVDARDSAEYLCGTIPGAVSMPFEYLPEDGLEEYIDTTLGGVSKDQRIITFCSGEECDLSLHLARNLQDLGYTNVSIFFGGAREWEDAGYEIQRSPECGNY